MPTLMHSLMRRFMIRNDNGQQPRFKIAGSRTEPFIVSRRVFTFHRV